MIYEFGKGVYARRKSFPSVRVTPVGQASPNNRARHEVLICRLPGGEIWQKKEALSTLLLLCFLKHFWSRNE